MLRRIARTHYAPFDLVKIPIESTVLIEGTVHVRPESARRRRDTSGTGEIDVQVDNFVLLNPATPKLPFVPSDIHVPIPNDDLRARYRYLDLRRPSLTENLRKRSKVASLIRRVLENQGFMEVETPILLRSSPEGAREFLVPTRFRSSSSSTLTAASATTIASSTTIKLPPKSGEDTRRPESVEDTHTSTKSDDLPIPGYEATPSSSSRQLQPSLSQLRQGPQPRFQPQFYALPQSPQQPKQLLICSGAVDRYYQIAKCFRDEDGRKDRQPEFTQVDLEMAWVSWGVPPPSDSIGSHTGVGESSGSSTRITKPKSKDMSETSVYSSQRATNVRNTKAAASESDSEVGTSGGHSINDFTFATGVTASLGGSHGKISTDVPRACAPDDDSKSRRGADSDDLGSNSGSGADAALQFGSIWGKPRMGKQGGKSEDKDDSATSTNSGPASATVTQRAADGPHFSNPFITEDANIAPSLTSWGATSFPSTSEDQGLRNIAAATSAATAPNPTATSYTSTTFSYGASDGHPTPGGESSSDITTKNDNLNATGSGSGSRLLSLLSRSTRDSDTSGMMINTDANSPLASASSSDPSSSHPHPKPPLDHDHPLSSATLSSSSSSTSEALHAGVGLPHTPVSTASPSSSSDSSSRLTPRSSSENPRWTSEWRIGGSEVRDVVEMMIRQIWLEIEDKDVFTLPHGDKPPPGIGEATGAAHVAEAPAAHAAGMRTGGTRAKFRVMTYDEAMSRYGSDKPDLRFGLEIKDMTCSLPSANQLALENAGDVIECLVVRKTEAEFNAASKSLGKSESKEEERIRVSEKNLWTWMTKSMIILGSCDLSTALDEAAHLHVNHDFNLKPGDEIWISRRGKVPKGGSTVLGRRRLRISELAQQKFDLEYPSDPKFLWVTEFPLFTHSDSDKEFLAKGRWTSSHHPFTAPMWEDIERMYAGDIESVRGQHYDLVLDGVEIGGGSVRVHDARMQEHIFSHVLQLTESEREPFNQLLHALQCGAPPHGGIALGFDRLMTILCKAASIRDVIAFPKTSVGTDLLFRSPAIVPSDTLEQYGIRPL